MKDQPAKRGAHAWLKDYAPAPGVADELFAPDGTLRDVWQPFLDRLDALSEDALRIRFERGNQYLRDAGVYFRRYSGDPLDEREWPLSHIPVILHEREWTAICDGLAQRADLLEAVMADLYGPGTLVGDGHLPAELVAGSDAWLRPMVGVPPRGGHYLNFLAFEIGRSPDGSWLVLGDRTDAPSGAGFALENRMASGRIFPESAPAARTHTLTSFFESFRETLHRLARSDTGAARQMGLLTPGSANDAFFEHLYIARHLGLLLLEGEDVGVENGQAVVRTIEGPVPLGVLWRRIDSDFADPLELDPGSRIGIPGLVEAARQGSLALVNALGSGYLETRALMAFLPRISRVLTGQPLKMPNIATWWCGAATERAYVGRNARRMLIGPALSVDLPFALGGDTALAGAFPDPEHAPLGDWLAAHGPGLVGQEAVTLSTTPSWRETPDGARLAPCPMTVRVFAARTETGWSFLKGGYARIGPEGNATALAMQQGGSVADVWVVSDTPVARRGPAPARDRHARPAAEDGALPARAADNLYWLGRYIVRFEDAARVLRAYHLRLATAASPEDDPILAAIRRMLAGVGIDAQQPMPAGLMDRIEAAHRAAARIRDRFSIDGWAALDDLRRTARALEASGAGSGDDAARAMNALLRRSASFTGMVSENMYRFAGWRFLSFGRALERSDTLTLVLATFADPAAPDGALELAIDLGDGAIAHRRRYAGEATRETVIDLLALDPGNPRSLVAQFCELQVQAQAMPGAHDRARPSALLRAILPLRTRIEVAEPGDLDSAAFLGLRRSLADISNRLASAYLR